MLEKIPKCPKCKKEPVQYVEYGNIAYIFNVYGGNLDNDGILEPDYYKKVQAICKCGHYWTIRKKDMKDITEIYEKLGSKQ